MPVLTENAHAQVEWKDRYVVINHETQKNHTIAYPTRDDYTLIVWEDNRNGDWDIYAQLIDNTYGVAKWQADGIPICDADGDQINPVAAYDTLGGVIITWEDYRNGGTLFSGEAYGEVFGNRIVISTGAYDGSWGGNSSGAQINLNPAKHIAIVGVGDGAYIAWADNRHATVNTPDDWEIYLSYVKSDYTVPSCSVGVWPNLWTTPWTLSGIRITNDDKTQLNPQLALDTRWDEYCSPNYVQLGVVIAWEDYRNQYQSRYFSNIYAKYVDPVGRQQSEVRFDQTNYSQVNHRLTSTGGIPGDVNPNNVLGVGVVLAWEDSRGNSVDIYGGLYDRFANPTNAYSVQVTSASYAQLRPRLTAIHSISPTPIVIVWEDYRNTVADIYGDVMQANNGSLSYNNKAICTSDSAQTKPDVDIVESSQNMYAVVAWEDARKPTPELDIYFQVYDDDLGTYYRDNNGSLATIARGDQTAPVVNKDIFVFGDLRRKTIPADTVSSDWNIYAQKAGGECDNPDISLRWREVYVKWTPSTDAENVKMAIDSVGNSYYVWNENRGVSNGVYIQKVDRYGVPRWMNNGLLLSTSGDNAQKPDVCIAGTTTGDVYVVWHEVPSGSSDSRVRIVMVEADGTATDIDNISDSNVDYLNPVVVAEMSMSTAGVTYYPAGYVAYHNDSNEPFIAYFTVASGVVNTDDQDLSDHDGQQPKISTDYVRGCWALFVNGNKFTYMKSNEYYSHGDTKSGFFNADATVTGFDIATDVFPVVRFNYDWYPYNMLYSYTTADKIAVGRLGIKNASSTGALGVTDYGIGEIPFTPSGNDVYSQPTIDADSLNDLGCQNCIEAGGAMVAWSNHTSYGYQVLSNRVMFYWDQGVNPNKWQVDPYYVDGSWNPNHILYADSLTRLPEPHIARLQKEVSTTIAFGGVVWSDSRSITCSPINHIRMQIGNYDYYDQERPDKVPLLGKIGVQVSPLATNHTQSSPFILKATLSDMSIGWIDDRPSSDCILSTNMFMDQITFTEGWRKDRRISSTPESFAVQVSPNPVLDSYLRLHVSGYRSTFIDIHVSNMLGQKVLSYRKSVAEAEAHIQLPLNSLNSGSYLITIHDGKTIKTERFTLLR